MAVVRLKTQLVQADYTTAAGKELLDQHFPEIRWKKTMRSVYIIIGFVGFFFLGSIAGLVFIPSSGVRIMLGIVAIFLGGVIARVWMNRTDELILNADGITYPGWKQPVRFAEVDAIDYLKINGKTMLRLRFKGKPPNFLRGSLSEFKSIHVKRLLIGSDPR